MPSNTAKTFKKLAAMMELDKDAELDGVARFLASAKESPA